MTSTKLLMDLAPSRGLMVSMSVTVWQGYLPTGHRCVWYDAFYFITVPTVNGGEMLQNKGRRFVRGIGEFI